MRGSVAALLLLPWMLLLHAAAAGNGSCARTCGPLTVQYPFGFSPGCEIPLGCDDQANGTAWIGGARELGLLVSNVTARAVVLALPQDCSRGLNASIQALFSKSYSPGSQNALVLSACSPVVWHTSNCSYGDRYLDRSSRCNATTEPIRCVLPPVAPPPIRSASVHRFFNRTEMQTLAAECTGLVSADSYWDVPSAAAALLLGVMELEWWVSGTCRCSRDAICTPVTTPTAGQEAFRCECREGFHGDGFADGAGCWKGSQTESPVIIPEEPEEQPEVQPQEVTEADEEDVEELPECPDHHPSSFDRDGQMYYGYCINCLYPAMSDA